MKTIKLIIKIFGIILFPLLFIITPLIKLLLPSPWLKTYLFYSKYPQKRKIEKIPIKHQPQKNGFSCGQTVIQMKFEHHGMTMSQEQLIQMAGDQKVGTTIWEIRDLINYLFEKQGLLLKAYIETYATYDLLEQEIAKGRDVIVMFMSSYHQEGFSLRAVYPHYGILKYISFEKNKVIIQSPSSDEVLHNENGKEKGECEMPLQEFLERLYAVPKYLRKIEYAPTMRRKQELKNFGNWILNQLFKFIIFSAYYLRVLKPGTVIITKDHTVGRYGFFCSGYLFQKDYTQKCYKFFIHNTMPMEYPALKKEDQQVYEAIVGEQKRQSEGMELIASENYQSQAVLEAQSSHLANKYAEGTPGRRYYGGQEFTDTVEQLAIDRAKQIFRADHANVQALSGAAANLCAYAALMQPGDAILGMDLSHGGHLTHGAPVTFMSKVFNFQRYKTKADGKIDFDQVRALAHEFKPKVILAGFSAYPRELEYEKFAEIAREVGAIAYADVSHIGGLIAGQALKNPLDFGFHAAMTTTHKSLRGPRGAVILSKGIVSNPLKKPEDTIENIPTRIDRAVFPGVQGGPHMNTIAGIAVALKEAGTKEFQAYAQQTIKNAKTLAQELLSYGYQLVTGGTDNHMMVVNFQGTELNGAIAEKLLDHVGISTSKSTIPDDPNPPFTPSGLRIGMAAMTTRGFQENETKQLANIINQVLKSGGDETVLLKLKQDVQQLAHQFPVPGL